MKKYVKPELFYEHYELSQHIADCEWEYTHDEGGCIAQGDDDDGLGAYQMFSGQLAACNVEPSKVENFCYHQSVYGSKLFQS